MDPKFIAKPLTTVNIDQMSKCGSHHQLSHSDTSFHLATNFDDLLLFNASNLDISNFSLPPLLQSSGVVANIPMVFGSDEFGERPRLEETPTIGNLQSSLSSLDSDFFDRLEFRQDDNEIVAKKGRDGQRVNHNSMDGSTTTLFKADSTMVMTDNVKKALTSDKLAELALIDPKRAKRIIANRQSAARSKEKKNRYAIELERKEERLRTEATKLSTHLTMLKIDTTNFAAKNMESKMCLEAMRQEAQHKEDIREALKEDVKRLREQTSLLGAILGNSSLFNQLLQLSNSAPQHAQMQPQVGMPPPPSGQNYPNFMDFNHQK